MKKKVMMVGAGLALGSALVVTSAFAGIGGAQGYEAYKTAIKNAAAYGSATHQVELSVRDNGSELLNVNATVKEDKAAGLASGNAAIQSGAESQTFEFYDRDGQSVFKAGGSDTYNVVGESGKRGKDGEEWDHGPGSQEMENIVDALVGNLKTKVNLSDAPGGGQKVDVTLSGTQIPSAVNVIGSIIVKEALSGKHAQEDLDDPDFGANALGLDLKQIAAHFPKLSQDVNIDEISLHASIDGNGTLADQTVEFTISGKDASGGAHEVVIEADMTLSNLGSTTPDTVDLTGKNVRNIENIRHPND